MCRRAGGRGIARPKVRWRNLCSGERELGSYVGGENTSLGPCSAAPHGDLKLTLFSLCLRKPLRWAALSSVQAA